MLLLHSSELSSFITLHSQGTDCLQVTDAMEVLQGTRVGTNADRVRLKQEAGRMWLFLPVNSFSILCHKLLTSDVVFYILEVTSSVLTSGFSSLKPALSQIKRNIIYINEIKTCADI